MAEKKMAINGILVMAKVAMMSSEEITDKILERFEKEETVLSKSGQRVMDSFRKLLRRQMGLKEDYTKLSRKEKIAEARKRIWDDFKIARKEIKRQNPVDYLLDRALDPLDPMNVVYRLILKTLGAEIDEKQNTIRLSPKLKSIFSNTPGLENIKPNNHPLQAKRLFSSKSLGVI